MDSHNDPLAQDPFYTTGTDPTDRTLVNPVKSLDLKSSAAKKVRIPFQFMCSLRTITSELKFNYESTSAVLLALKRVFILSSQVVISKNTFPASLRLTIPGVEPTCVNTLSKGPCSLSSLLLFPGNTSGVSTDENRADTALDLINRWGNLTEEMIKTDRVITSKQNGHEYWTLPSDHPVVYIVKCNMSSWLGDSVTSLVEYADTRTTEREIFGHIYNVPSTYTLPREACEYGQSALRGLLQTFKAIDLTKIDFLAQAAVGDDIFAKPNMVGAEGMSTEPPFILQGYVDYTYISANSQA